jgi:hypothetical protein
MLGLSSACLAVDGFEEAVTPGSAGGVLRFPLFAQSHQAFPFSRCCPASSVGAGQRYFASVFMTRRVARSSRSPESCSRA